MRTSRTMLLLAAACLIGLPQLAAAEDDAVAEQLRLMQERLSDLESRLDATTDELEHANQRVEEQAELIEQSGIADPAGSSSGLASFFETIEIGGWVAASYNYNFRDPDGRDLEGFNAGPNGVFYPFHPDPNSFQVDQFWLELERAVNEENRGGFRVDLLWGKTAELLNASANLIRDGDGDIIGAETRGFSGSDDQFELYQAYIQYLAPVLGGVHFKFGKFATVIGAEVAQAPYNLNITRGNVYNLLQPFTHTGITAEVGFMEKGSLLFGAVNETRSFTARDIDYNKNKALLWSLGWGEDVWGISFNGTYGDADSGQCGGTLCLGATDTNAGDKEYILDSVITFDPIEELTSYINFTYLNSDNSNGAGAFEATGEVQGYGIAGAARYAITDRMGLALRAEWVDLTNEIQIGRNQRFKVWNITTTADYSLTDDLLIRIEGRYDDSSNSTQRSGADPTVTNNQFFDSDRDGTKSSQVVGAVEVIYQF